MLTFNIFIILNLVLFIIILLVTSFNILEDDKKTNLMYRALGFSKTKIITSSIIKIFLLFLLALLISVIIALIFYLFIT